MANAYTVNRIGLFRGDGFQTFCGVLLSAADPSFQAVDGSGGDLGNDGYRVAGETIFQAYGPATRIADKVRAKIDDSVAKVRALRATFPRLVRFVFLTPFDLTHDQHTHLRAAASAVGLRAESWGETKLLAMLAERPHVKSEFPHLLLPDVIDEIRKLHAALAPPPAPPIAHGFPIWDRVPLEPDPADPSRPRGAYAAATLEVRSASLALPSLEPSHEDAFVDAIHERFWHDPAAALTARSDQRIIIENKPDDLHYHRLWGRWTWGAVSFSSTLRDLHRPGSYSVADLAGDVTRALRLAALLGVEGPACVTLKYSPYDLRAEFNPSDKRVRDVRLGGVHSVLEPAIELAIRQGREATAHHHCDLSSLADDAHGITALLLVPLLRNLHGARIDTAEFAASIPRVIAAEFDAQHR